MGYASIPGYEWKQGAASEAALPLVGNSLGDVRTISSPLGAKQWNGSAWVDFGSGGGGSGDVVGPASSTQYQLSYFNDGTGKLIANAALITANRALISNANGLPVHSAVTNTELGYVGGVTSAIQTQLDTKAPSTSPSFTTSARFNYSTASRVPYLDSNKDLIASAVTPTELGYVSGVTSAIQTQIDAKAASVTSEIWLSNITGYGSTGIHRRLFGTIQRNNGGADMTVSNSATAGTTITLNTTGRYAFFYVDRAVTALNWSINLNVANAALDFYDAANIAGILSWGTNQSASAAVCIAIEANFTAGDVISPMGDLTGGSNSLGYFRAVRTA